MFGIDLLMQIFSTSDFNLLCPAGAPNKGLRNSRVCLEAIFLIAEWYSYVVIVGGLSIILNGLSIFKKAISRYIYGSQYANIS